MRHRAPRPLIDLLPRLRRSAATAVSTVARQGPLRVLVGVLVVLGLGTLTLGVAPSLVGGESDDRAADTAAPSQRSEPTVSRDGGRTSPDADGSESRRTGGPTPTPSASPSPSAAASPSAAPGSPTDSASPVRARTSPEAAPALPPSSAPEPTSETGSPEPADATPPETSLTAEYPTGDAARFTLGADEAATFACSLDGAAYTACDSPTLYSELEPGWHTFAVRATDAAGNVDPSPAEERWLATRAESGQG